MILNIFKLNGDRDLAFSRWMIMNFQSFQTKNVSIRNWKLILIKSNLI